jgi:hypothetical protein
MCMFHGVIMQGRAQICRFFSCSHKYIASWMPTGSKMLGGHLASSFKWEWRRLVSFGCHGQQWSRSPSTFGTPLMIGWWRTQSQITHVGENSTKKCLFAVNNCFSMYTVDDRWSNPPVGEWGGGIEPCQRLKEVALKQLVWLSQNKKTTSFISLIYFSQLVNLSSWEKSPLRVLLSFDSYIVVGPVVPTQLIGNF